MDHGLLKTYKIKDPPKDPRITDWINRPSPERIIPDKYISLIHYVFAKPEFWTYFANPFSKFYRSRCRTRSKWTKCIVPQCMFRWCRWLWLLLWFHPTNQHTNQTTKCSTNQTLNQPSNAIFNQYFFIIVLMINQCHLPWDASKPSNK